MTSTQDFLINKIKEKQGNYFSVIKRLLDVDIDKQKVIDIYDKYKKHKNLLNDSDIYFFQYLNAESDSIKKQFEEFSDDIHKTVVKSHHKKIKKLLYSKHNDIMNKDTDNIIQLFAEKNISTKIIKQFVGKKIRSFKNSEDLNTELTKLYDQINGSWNIESYLEKIKNTNSKIIYNKDNMLAVEILNFEDSKKLGTNNWCVAREEMFYYDYTENNERFVFVFDFDKAPFLEDSMKAVIVEVDGNIHETYNKADVKIHNHDIRNKEEIFKPITKETLMYKINNNRKIIDSPNLIAMDYIVYGLYDEAKEILQDRYTKDLSYSFSNKLSKIVNGKNTISFLNEFSNNVGKNINEINSYDIFEWIREISYLDKETINDFFKIPIVKKLVQNELKDIDQEIKEHELADSVSHFFSGFFEEKFNNGLNFIKKLSDIGIENTQDLINFRSVSRKGLEFLNDHGLVNKKFDTGVLKSNKDEEFFDKYFEIIDLKSKGAEAYKEIADNLFLSLIQSNNLYNYHGLHFGLKSYLKEDFEKVKKESFVFNNEKMNIFNIMVPPSKIKESFTVFSSLFHIEKITPEITNDILIKTLYNKAPEEYSKFSKEEKLLKLKENFESIPYPLKKDFIKFINHESFDLSGSKELLTDLSKIEGFDNIKTKKTRKLSF